MILSAAMPNTRSAAKRVRADAHRRLRNLEVRSELKTLIRKFREALRAGGEGAQTAYRHLVKRLDQAARRNIIHRNTASRRKSRLARQLQKKTAGK